MRAAGAGVPAVSLRAEVRPADLRRPVPHPKPGAHSRLRFFGSIGLTFRLASNNPDSSLRLITGDFYAVGQLGHPFSTYRLMTYLPFRFRALRAA